MNITEAVSHIDHTALGVAITEKDIKVLIDEAVFHGAASVCIPPSFVSFAKDYSECKLPICTVIGFPNGYMTSKAKLYEAACALEDGADELDMVINVGALKVGNEALVLREIRDIKTLCGKNILKVIIEACLLTDDEKVIMCRLVEEGGADFIKTSTGFSTGGATEADILIFKKHLSPKIKIKAAGGIRTLEDCIRYLELGCDRIGSSAIIKALRKEKNDTF